VGLTPEDLVGDPLRWAGTGLEFGYLHVHPDAVARSRPNLAAISGLHPSSQISVFSYVDGVARARVFAGGLGVDEDPATGSAALGLGVWLAACGLVSSDGETSYVVEQGLEIGRPSRLECAVRCESGVAVEGRVTGSVVPIAEGRIRVPD
jgi:trans-2,3-dihydro-3-hydroxyanthranilate isomerase